MSGRRGGIDNRALLELLHLALALAILARTAFPVHIYVRGMDLISPVRLLKISRIGISGLSVMSISSASRRVI